MKHCFITLLLLPVISCGQAQSRSQAILNNATSDKANQPPKSMSDYLPTRAKANPNAKRLMNEDFYWSPIEQTAPFGNDDGADTYAGFAAWRQTHKTENPKEFLTEQIGYWGYPTFKFDETDFSKLKSYIKQSDLGSRYMSGIDAAIVAIAFGQLYLEGQVNKDFKVFAISSIKRQLIPEILSLWGEPYKLIRETQLKKMLAVLDQID